MTEEDLSKREVNIVTKIAKIRGLPSTANQTVEKKYHPYILVSFDLERRHRNFGRDIRNMNDEEKINDLENEIIRVINSLRPFRISLRDTLKQIRKLLDKNDKSQEAENYRKKTLDYLVELERYKNSTQDSNKFMYLSYGRERSAVDDLIYDLLVKLREQSLASLTE
jgi:hypothetical protein